MKIHSLSISRACCIMDVTRSTCYYRSKKDDSEVEAALRACVETGKSTDGFWKIFQRLRREGHPWNHKRVYRVYKKLNYNKRLRGNKKPDDGE